MTVPTGSANPAQAGVPNAVQRVSRCCLCGGQERRLLFPISFRAPNGTIEFGVVECAECGFAYLDPIPTASLFDVLYPPGEYYSFQSSDVCWRFRLKTWAMTRAAESTSSGFSWNGVTRLVARQISRALMTTLPPGKSGRLLDGGCGAGDLLMQARRTGRWEVWGIERSPAGAGRARQRGLDVFCGELPEASFPAGFFDAVILSHVIEHVQDPLSLLKECRRVLKDDGVVLVVTPNFACFDGITFGEHWRHLSVPQHLCFFTPDSLTRALTLAGFVVVERRFSVFPKKRDDLALLGLQIMWMDRARFGRLHLAWRTCRAAIRTLVLKPPLLVFGYRRQHLGDTMSFWAVNKL